MNSLRKTLWEAIFSPTGKNAAITFFAMAVNTGFSAAFFIILARVLGSASLGLFSVALALMMVVTAIADLGTSQGILRFAPKSAGAGKTADLLAYLRLGFLAKLIFGVVGTALVAGLAYPLALYVFRRPELGPLFLLSSVGVLTGLLFSFGLVSLQALQRFLVWGFLQAGWSAARLLVLFVLIFLGILSPPAAILVYAGALLIPFLGAWSFLPKKFLQQAITKNHIRNFFLFNRWMAFFNVILAVSGNLDRFFLARFSSLSEVGYYTAAAQVAGVGLQAHAALGTVLIPKFASFQNLRAMGGFLKKVVLLTGSMALGGVLISLLAEPLVRIIFGEGYLSSILPTRILIVSVALILASLPFTSIWLYFLGHSKTYALYYVVNGMVLFLGNWILVPIYGAVGSAIASLIGNALTLTVSFGYVLIFWKKNR